MKIFSKTNKLLALMVIAGLLLTVSCQKKPEKKYAPPGMAQVPAGEFVMGTNKEADFESSSAAFIVKPWYADESPARKIYLNAYYIDKYEVTNKDYKKYIETAKPKHRAYSWGKEDTYKPEMENWPLTYINWYEANDFCFYYGKRLPSEAEWEKAARGPDERIYPWGNEFDISKAHLAKKSGDVPAFMPVGSFEGGKSIYGVYDMIGNAWEWIYDEYNAYPGSDYAIEEFDKKKRVVRGLSKVEVGHYPNDQYKEVLALYARAGYRSALKPLQRYNDVGIRCVKSASTPYKKDKN